MSGILQKIVWISIGSAVGGNARYWLGAWIQHRWGSAFPLGTFVINISGSFILGFFVALILGKVDLPHVDALRLLIAIGFVGSYTTFSTFQYETFALAETGAFFLALVNALGSLVVGFLAVWIGTAAARVI